MSVAHLDILHSELPELFQTGGLSPAWDDGLVIVPIDNPESHLGDSAGRSPLDEEALNYVDLERLAAEPTTEIASMPTVPPEILDALGGAHPGAPASTIDPKEMPPPECFAFYLPFHYYYPTWWGVYLLLEGIQWLAHEIVRRSDGEVSAREAICAARMFLYYHEAFHHKTECFATRLEVTHRKPFYKTGFEHYFQKTIGTDDCVEEGLANATALELTRKSLRHKAIDHALAGYVADSPPGYRRGNEIRLQLSPVRCQFAEENRNFCLPHLPRKSPKVWHTVPHMFHGMFNIKSHVNYVISRNSPLIARMRMRPLLPPKKLVKKLETLADVQFVRNGGRHDIYRAKNDATIPIPRDPRDLTRGLLRDILREAGLQMSVEQFMHS
jgi:predicted RNA binding protein YcfA (HicA-like mRNA interferase family)